ncbi:MAG: hypothetical protein AAF658_22225 [Myxococcota bacterium]
MELSFDTPTVAELFLRQGQTSRAAAIYRKVLVKDPENERAAARLRQIEARLSEEGGTMDFRQTMQDLVQSTPGAMACTLMGFDGIPIDSYEVGGAEIDLQALLTELSSLAAIAKGLKNNHPTGELATLALDSERLQAVVRPLTEEYFMAMILSPSSIPGKAGFEMRLLAPKLIAELS